MKNFINWSFSEPTCPEPASEAPPQSAFSTPYLLLSSATADAPTPSSLITSSQLPSSALGSSAAAEYLAALVSNSQLNCQQILLPQQQQSQFTEPGSTANQTAFSGHQSATEALIAALAQSAQQSVNNSRGPTSFGHSLANNLVSSVANPSSVNTAFSAQSSANTLTSNSDSVTLSGVNIPNVNFSPGNNLSNNPNNSAFQLVGGLPPPRFPVLSLQNQSLQLGSAIPLLSQLVNQHHQQSTQDAQQQAQLQQHQQQLQFQVQIIFCLSQI